MQQIYIDQLRDLFSWREKRSGTIMPEERLPWGNTVAMGMQHVLAMFGSTVIAPLLMGFDPNLAILFSGIGTLLFFLITAGRIPSYLGSSFAFIAPVGAVMAGGGGMGQALGGIIAAGFVYLLIGLVVQFLGSDWIDALMPPLVTGAVVAIIGLNLASAAKGLAEQSMPLAILTIIAVMVVAIAGRGMLGRLPILIGTVFGYLIALILGGTSADGRSIGPMHITGVDFEPVKQAAWIGWPNFTGPSFNWHAISLIAPVAIVLVAENTGHIKAVSEMTGRNLMPFLGRGFIGDGAATMVAGLGGGTGVTTYAENIGVMAVTRVFSTAMFVVAAATAVVLGFVPKFGALIQSIPAGVLGGVSTVLFGLIAVTGIRIWVENRVDFSKSTNLFIVAVTLIAGAANYTLQFGDFALEGIAIGTFGAIILYQVFAYFGFDQLEIAGGPADGADVERVPRGGQSRRPVSRRDRGQASSQPSMSLDPRTLREAFGGEHEGPRPTATPRREGARPTPRREDDGARRSQTDPRLQQEPRPAPQGRPRPSSQPEPYDDDRYDDWGMTQPEPPRRASAPGQQRGPAGPGASQPPASQRRPVAPPPSDPRSAARSDPRRAQQGPPRQAPAPSPRLTPRPRRDVNDPDDYER